MNANRATWMPPGRSLRSYLMVLLCAAALGPARAPTASAGPETSARFIVEGGADESGHIYTWTITNMHTSPIVELILPNYRTDRFAVPDGWSTEGTTHLVAQGGAEQPGICKATATPPNAGVPPAGSIDLRMRVMPKGAPVGLGTVRVGFADGTSASVDHVEVPVPEAMVIKYARFIGLAGLFARTASSAS